MYKVYLACIAIVLFPCFVFAQGSVARAGTTPESPFYFFDRLAESVTEILTPSAPARARLQLSFAAERIAEIEVMLSARGISARGIAVAEKALAKHLAKSEAIAKRERNNKNEAGARVITEGMQKEKESIAQVFHRYKKAFDEKMRKTQETTEDMRAEKELINAKIGAYEQKYEKELPEAAQPIFDRDGSVNERERERLDQSIKSLEEEIRRTEEFLRQKKNEQ